MVGIILQRVRPRCAFNRPHVSWGRTALRWNSSAASARVRGEDVRIETLTAKWQPHWDKLSPQWHQLRNSHKGKAYVLPMFPYPSGTLHLGHLRVYTISDVLSRFKHMQGYKVLHPIGWDAFGLPAENAAIERGVHPEKWTLRNIDAMKSQMEVMGGRWDWENEIRTCDPDFYKHTQRIFLMLHERGLAYQAESMVNYDPIDQTVLANEQVDANGCSWRSGARVEKLMLKQWFLKIKEFQEPLLKDMDSLAEEGRWPEKVLSMQKNWIGKSVGAKLQFDISSTNGGEQLDPVEVFTTRADTLFGVQYLALSLKHPIVQRMAATDSSLQKFIEQASNLPPDSKEGYRLPDVIAQNPLGDLDLPCEVSIPIYVAPYVLDDYGSGAVMGVPGHDARDHAFWRENTGNSSIKVVVSAEQGGEIAELLPGSESDRPLTQKGFVASNIKEFGGLSSNEAARKLVKTLRKAGKNAKMTATWRLRDWLISRQRYWGTPIPIIHCDSCGAVPVPEKDLPVVLPDLPDSFFQGRRGNPLAEDESWKKTSCPKCGSPAERETDTMDTFMDSSWYFFRFLNAKNKDALVDPKIANEGMPVDLYIGGVEHAILHLLYARFISKFLATTSVWPEGSKVLGEPFKQLITQGMVHGETFTDPENGRFLRPDEVDLSKPSRPLIKASGVVPNVSYEKMSKSKYNGVDPGATIATYGADATRAHMLFQAPVGDVLEWDEKKITGVQRWLYRVMKLVIASSDLNEDQARNLPENIDMKLNELLQHLAEQNVLPNEDVALKQLISTLNPTDTQLWIDLQKTIASVTASYTQVYSLNTVISDLMTLTNTITTIALDATSSPATPYLKYLATIHLIRMLAPVAPGVAEEAFNILSPPLNASNNPSQPQTVFATNFPTADLEIITHLTRTQRCVVQVDGKRKFELDIPVMDDELARDEVAAAQWILGEIAASEEGKEWLDRGNGKVWKLSGDVEEDEVLKGLPRGWKVRFVGGGRLCNLVAPRKKGKKV